MLCKKKIFQIPRYFERILQQKEKLAILKRYALQATPIN